MNSKKIIYWIGGVIIVMGLIATIVNVFSSKEPTGPVAASIYGFKMNSLDGKEIDFTRYKGKKLLIVNTASKCGKTPQFAGLEKIHEQFGDRITVLGFPANNFFWQEPGSSTDIAEFCERNYGVQFQMFEKLSVKGSDQHPLYQWLQSKTGKKPDWNFAKYVVNEDGTRVTFFDSDIQPMDSQIIDQITK
jgi:glutathione peroxidase